jgi:hypothetical protein
MSYASQSALANDTDFQKRMTACCNQQAVTYKDDARPNFVALANSVLRAEGRAMPSFFNMGSASPGFADDVDNSDGTVDSSRLSDLQLLAAVQNDWPTVAGLYFDDTGAPIT